MRNLIIGNVDNESMVGDSARLPYEIKCEDATVANRLTWLVENGDALLLPSPISQAFLEYVCSLIGVDARTIRVIVPPGGEQSPQLITFDVLGDPEMLGRIRSVTEDPGSWTVTPYYFDKAVAWLVGHFGLALDEPLRRYFRQGGSDQFNSKVSFRRIAAGHHIPVAEGYICSSVVEFQASLLELIEVTGAVIIKQDCNAGGEGNLVVTLGGETRMNGALETMPLGSKSDLKTMAPQIWARMIGRGNSQLVVEAYYKDAVSYYSELEVPASRQSPVLLNFGEMRMDPTWVGFEIPGSKLTLAQLGDFAAWSLKLADVARTMGYVGKINCDAILTRTGRVLFTEINGRLGGCTHIDVLARRLFGADYGNRMTILTRNRVPTGDFSTALEALNREGWLFTPQRGKGAVILTEDTRRTGTVEYMVTAAHPSEAHELEVAVRRTLERCCK